MSELDCATQWQSVPVGTYTEGRKGQASEDIGLCLARAAWFQEVGCGQKQDIKGLRAPQCDSGSEGARFWKRARAWGVGPDATPEGPTQQGSLSAAVLAEASELTRQMLCLHGQRWTCGGPPQDRRLYQSRQRTARGPSTSFINDPHPCVCVTLFLKWLLYAGGGMWPVTFLFILISSYWVQKLL